MKPQGKWRKSVPANRLRLTGQARRDIAKQLDFIERQPWGQRKDRERELDICLNNVRRWPTQRKVQIRRANGVDLRRWNAGQLVVIYACRAGNIVSIRAVRHRREKSIFAGVREPTATY